MIAPMQTRRHRLLDKNIWNHKYYLRGDTPSHMRSILIACGLSSVLLCSIVKTKHVSRGCFEWENLIDEQKIKCVENSQPYYLHCIFKEVDLAINRSTDHFRSELREPSIFENPSLRSSRLTCKSTIVPSH